MDCDFTLNFCQWSQAKEDVFDWTRTSGPTSTVNTGPTGDHTSPDGMYDSRTGAVVYHQCAGAPRFKYSKPIQSSNTFNRTIKSSNTFNRTIKSSVTFSKRFDLSVYKVCGRWSYILNGLPLNRALYNTYMSRSLSIATFKYLSTGNRCSILILSRSYQGYEWGGHCCTYIAEMPTNGVLGGDRESDGFQVVPTRQRRSTGVTTDTVTSTIDTLCSL